MKKGFATMSWIRNDIDKIAAVDELQLVTLKQDGTQRKPVIVWMVRVDDDLFVRAYRGRECAWFRHVEQRRDGSISAGGVTNEVTFVDVSADAALNDRIDAAYQSKYQRYGTSYVRSINAPLARVTTLKLVPAA